MKCFVEYMKGIYGKNMPFVKGKKHTYVRMDFNYSSPGEVIVSMESYTTEAIEKLPEETMKKKRQWGTTFLRLTMHVDNCAKEIR